MNVSNFSKVDDETGLVIRLDVRVQSGVVNIVKRANRRVCSFCTVDLTLKIYVTVVFCYSVGVSVTFQRRYNAKLETIIFCKLVSSQSWR